MQLKPKDIKPFREQLLIEQNGLCALCGQPCVDPCADHCHKHGNLRGIICRLCNNFVGFVERGRIRNRINDAKFEVITKNLVTYINNLREEVHPLHGKKAKRKKRTKLPKVKQ
jgi:hypothetical protein